MTVAALVDWRETDGKLEPWVLDDQGREQRAAWAPQEGSQTAFMQCPAEEVLYEGTRGPGKTDALLMAFAQHVGKGWGPEWRGIIFRQTFPQLSDIIIKAQKWFPIIFPGARYNEGNHKWAFPMGETLQFSYGAKEKDYWNYHGKEWPFLGFEELTTWSDPAFFLKMFSCCRSSMPGMPRMIRATTNPYGCVPYGDVLTQRGWLPIQDVQAGDFVLSVSPDGTLCKSRVEQLVDKRWSGTMIHRHGAGLDMVFTEDHRLPRLNADGSHSIQEFHDLPGQINIRRTANGWQGQPLKWFSPPQVRLKRQPRSPAPDRIQGLDCAELLGWLVSEGSARFGSCQFQISQTKSENRNRVRSLLDRCGFTYSETLNQYQVYSTRWARWAASLGPSSRFKRLPSWFLQCDEPILRRFFDTAMLGDGCRGVYYTLSQVLADQMSEIAVKLGYSVRVTSGTRAGRKYRGYAVCCSHRNTIQLVTGNHTYQVSTKCSSVNVTREHFAGRVYCLVVPGTETFFIRQNGCVWLSGNSGHNWVKMRYKLPVAPGEIYGPLIEEFDENGDPLPERIAIHGHLDENKILLTADPRYKAKIKAACKGNKAQELAWLEGSWDIIAGGMFDDVWDAKRHVVPNFDIPGSWRIYRAFDWGSSAPFSVGWWAESDGSDLKLPDGRICSTVRGDLFRVAEWYGWNGEPNEGLKMVDTEIAKGIIERELTMEIHDRCKPGPADASIFKTENGVCIAKGLQTAVFVKGKKRRIQFLPSNSAPGTRKMGWALMRERFLASNPGPDHRGPREFPGLFCLERCDQFRRTVPVLPRDMDKDPDDVDSSVEDHIGDESRYMVVFSGWKTKGGRVRGVAS